MQRFQRVRGLATRIMTLGASVPARWERLGIDHTLSLMAALAVIAISSLAFWWNLPDGLFDGGGPICASTSGTLHVNRSPSFTHGLMSLELFSAMVRTSPGPAISTDAGDHRLDMPDAPVSCTPAAQTGR